MPGHLIISIYPQLIIHVAPDVLNLKEASCKKISWKNKINEKTTLQKTAKS